MSEGENCTKELRSAGAAKRRFLYLRAEAEGIEKQIMKRESKTKKLIIITLMFYSASIDLFSQQNYVLGERKAVYSKILSEERSYNLYLPSDCQKSGARYPLLVVLDGYFLWTTGIVDYLAFSGNIPPMIIVAINNTDRDRDFTPTHSKNLEGEEVPTSGGARNFLRFIGEELLPLIDSAYRTEPFRLLAGHSMGALFVSFAMLEKPELFQACFACSPTLPWDNEWIVKYYPSSSEVYFRLANAQLKGNMTFEANKNLELALQYAKDKDEKEKIKAVITHLKQKE